MGNVGAVRVKRRRILRDQYIFFPWYARTPAARVQGGLPPPGEFHRGLVELLKAVETYHLAYHAAFRWDAAEALPPVLHPALVISAEDDPLLAGTRDAAALLPHGRFEMLPRYADAEFNTVRSDIIRRFLDASSSRVPIIA